MGFYKSVADYYHYMFPINRRQIEFLYKNYPRSNELDLLDIGCGTGALGYELAKEFNTVTGIDIDDVMLEKAKSKNPPDNLTFIKMDMLDISKNFEPNSKDIITCFGNTLVHLESPKAILKFFKQCKGILKEDGKLIIQIINYERILDQNISSLATIQNPEIKFERNYNYNKSKNIIDFNTTLTIKETGEEIKNSIPIYPLRRKEITPLISRAGFTGIRYYGNFRGDPLLLEESIPLLFETF